MKVVISGYYGFGNVGDEAVLEALVSGLKKWFPACEITVLSALPQNPSTQNNTRTIYRYDLIEIFRAIQRSDLLISGGGTLLQDVTSRRSLWYYLGIILLAKCLNKKVVILAQGFGPIRRKINQWLVRMVLN